MLQSHTFLLPGAGGPEFQLTDALWTIEFANLTGSRKKSNKLDEVGLSRKDQKFPFPFNSVYDLKLWNTRLSESQGEVEEQANHNARYNSHTF